MDRTIKIAFGLFIIIALVCAAFFVLPQLAEKNPAPGMGSAVQGKVTVYFFYGEECPHCYNVMPFIKSLKEKYPDVDFQILETWHNQTNWALFQSLNQNLGVKYAAVPEVIVGNVVLSGERDIPLHLEAVILEVLKKKIIPEGLERTESLSTSNISLRNSTVTAFYFYGDGCSHCAKVEPFLTDLVVKYPELDLRMLEIYHNATNQETFAVMKWQYGISSSGVPVLFIGTTAMVGNVDITNRFEAMILAEKERIASSITTTPSTVIIPDENSTPAATRITVPLVIASALIDSINPCAFSVLIFLLISIVSLENRRRILMVGGVYIAAVFIFYLLSGFGLFTIVSLSGFSRTLSLMGATVAVVLGIISVLDVLRNRDEFLLAIPSSKNGQIERYINKASLPAAFALGIFVGIFELPCTGGIYLAILGLMSRSYTLMEGLPYLILYNLIFVLPLILILLLVAYGLSPERANEWRVRHRRTLRLIVGLAMIALGVIIFSGWMG